MEHRRIATSVGEAEQPHLGLGIRFGAFNPGVFSLGACHDRINQLYLDIGIQWVGHRLKVPTLTSNYTSKLSDSQVFISDFI